MSTQFHTPDQETSSPPLHQQGGGPSRFRAWAVITGTAAVATLGLLMPGAASAAQIHHDPFPVSVLSLPGCRHVHRARRLAARRPPPAAGGG